MAARIFAVLAAVFLVVAIGFATLAPKEMNLGQGLTEISRTALTWSKDHSPDWLWQGVEMPFLRRPLWLLPGSLGVICAGLATTLTFGSPSPSRRRRS